MSPEKEHFEFRLRYKGKLHQIDSNTFLNSLLQVTGALQEINEELNRESSTKGSLKIRINAFERGSFEVLLDLLKDVSTDLLAPIVAVKAAELRNIINVFVDFIKLKRHLKGEKPKETQESGNKVVVVGNKGDMHIDRRTYNIYAKNLIVNESIAKNFDALRQDEAIEGFELSDSKGKSLIETTKSDFGDLTQRNKLLEEETKIVIEERAILLVTVAFKENYKWQFYYQGNQIFASIEDKKFLQKIDRNEKFGKGDVLICRLEIEKSLGETADAQSISSYKILHVLEHKPRAEQQDLLT